MEIKGTTLHKLTEIIPWKRCAVVKAKDGPTKYQKCALSLDQVVYFTQQFFCFLPVVEQYVGAFDVPVQEVVLMAVVQTFHQLAHEATDVLMGELDQA